MTIKEKIVALMPGRQTEALRLMKRSLQGKLTYNEDGLATEHNSDFASSPRFQKLYDNAVRLGLAASPNMRWRIHTLCWAAVHAKNIGGDFVECGVFKGFSSKIVTDYIGFGKMDSTFYLMDTFEQFGNLKPDWDATKKAFSGYGNVRFIKGKIPGTLEQVKSKRIAYLHIDMNHSPPEIAALEYFWGSIPKGGIILLDDYGFPGHEAQKQAFDSFALQKRVEILSLPTGQGLMVKPF